MSGYKIDLGVYESLQAYMQLGLHPGGFAASLLAHRPEEAMQRAHPLIKVPSYGETTSVAENMWTFVQEYIPFVAQGSDEIVQRWIDHNGLSGAPDSVKLVVKVGCEHPFWEKLKV